MTITNKIVHVADYFEILMLQAPISAQTQTDITEGKRDKKKARWRACANKSVLGSSRLGCMARACAEHDFGRRDHGDKH